MSKELSEKELEQLEEKLIAGAIVELGDEYIKQVKWSGPKTFILQLLYFDAGGDFSGVDEAPGYLRNDDPTDPDSIYHLFGNDFEYWYDCKVYETPEQYATARLEAYKKKLVEWLENQKNNAAELCEKMDNEHCTERATYYDGQYEAYRTSIDHLTRKP